MKKLIFIAVAAIFAAPAMAQPVSDRGVIPVAVTLNQILRLNITNGGNIEFVFNTIDQYKNGIGPGTFYDTDFEVASSTPWKMNMGAEDLVFSGTDDPGNSMTLDNVGFSIDDLGIDYTLLTFEYLDPAGAFLSGVGGMGLTTYPTLVISSGPSPTTNAGDVVDNSFTIHWEAGTSALAGMNPFAILFQVPAVEPDRYVTNVLLDIEID